MMAIGIWGFPTPATGGRSGWGQGLEMKKLASAIVALAALAASPAMAADMPVKYVPPAPPPVFSWSGCYIGVHVGAGWQVSSFAGGESSGGSVPASGVGWLGGGQAGCNLQWRAFVIGVEGEVWGSTLYDRFFSQFGPFTDELQSRNRWDGAVSVRSGIAFDREGDGPSLDIVVRATSADGSQAA